MVDSTKDLRFGYVKWAIDVLFVFFPLSLAALSTFFKVDICDWDFILQDISLMLLSIIVNFSLMCLEYMDESSKAGMAIVFFLTFIVGGACVFIYTFFSIMLNVNQEIEKVGRLTLVQWTSAIRPRIKMMYGVLLGLAVVILILGIIMQRRHRKQCGKKTYYS